MVVRGWHKGAEQGASGWRAVVACGVGYVENAQQWGREGVRLQGARLTVGPKGGGTVLAVGGGW